jgi:hydrogenase maturation factor HypF (carbamoyltransferase family)
MDEGDALRRRDRPIVVVARRAESTLAPSLAPGQSTVGA